MLTNNAGVSSFMEFAKFETAELLSRLLQDPRVRAAVNMKVPDGDGNTALIYACTDLKDEVAAPKVHLLLQAGANPLLTNTDGLMPVGFTRRNCCYHHAVIALLEQYPAAQKDAEKTSLLVKARCLAIAANGNVMAPSCLQNRLAQGRPLPRLQLRRVVLTSVTGGPDEDDEENRTLHSLCTFLLGVGGPRGEGMPRDVFGVVMDMLMPSWDPLRRKNVSTEPAAVQG